MDFLQTLAERPLLADGAMGTMIYAQGIDFEQSFDELNLIHPDVVREIHRAYIAAGADIIETNTFSATPIHLAKWNVDDKADAINRAGAALARQAAKESARQVFVAGSVGPTGARLAPTGPLKPEEARASFKTQISALAESGVDLLLFETFSDLREIEIAIDVARAVCDLPIVASMSFNREVRTLTGSAPEQAWARLSALGVAAIGANCSTGPRGVLEVLGRYGAAAEPGSAAKPTLSAMPNAGYPESRGERLFYPATAEYFANYARRFYDAGARIIGGCCGTTPEHIAGMRRALDALAGGAPSAPRSFRISTVQVTPDALTVGEPRETVLAAALREGRFVATVEMEPPKSADTRDLEANAQLLRDAGATVLDISDIPMARMRMTGLAAAIKVQQAATIETVLHFPVRGRNLLRVQGDLLAAHALNVRNLFVTMGDPASIGDYPQAFDNHDIVPTGLVQLIKEQFNCGKDSAGSSIGSACTFVVGVAANLTPSDFDKEAKLLKKKIDCGADFALTQPVFDPQIAHAFLDHYEKTIGPLKLPILIGILPLASPRHAVFLKNEVPGMLVPDELITRMDSAGDQARTEGRLIAGEVLSAMRARVQGVYFIPAFKRYDVVAQLIAELTPAAKAAR
jgi:methionine synthase / methylenetetrahydrofolate reductase(NADPH)